MEREHGDNPVECAITVNNEVSCEDDGGKEAKNTACQVQEEPTGAAGDFRRIFLQSSGINFRRKGNMLDSFSQFSHVARPVGGEVAAVTINRRQREYGKQSAG